jgi:hypothetical protein
VGHTFDISIERDGEKDDTFLRTWHLERVLHWLVDNSKFDVGVEGVVKITITPESEFDGLIITVTRKEST